MKKILKLTLITLISIICLFAIYRTFIKNNDLTVYGIIKYADGIGRQPIDLMNMLSEEDISINFIGHAESKQDIGKVAKNVLRNYNFKVGHIFINELPLNHYNKTKYKFQKSIYRFLAKINGLSRSEQIWLAYSMFESDSITLSWVDELNKNYDAVVVPDSNLVAVYENSGVKIPIFVVPLSVDFGDSLEQPIKTKANPIFTFANFSSIENRKNTLKTIKAFHQAFKKREDVKLLISARKEEKEEYDRSIKYIIENNLSNVDLHVSNKHKDLYNQYFNLVDCYISLSKGEGFSVQPREAMAKGIPVIVSNALAQKTIADSGFVKSVPANIKRPAFYNSNSIMIGRNFDVDTTDTANAMLDVYNNYQKYLDLAPKSREWVKQYSYDNIKPLFISLVNPKEIILGEKNEVTSTYIETNSKLLYLKYKNIMKK